MIRDQRETIPQTNPKANYLSHKSEIDRAMDRVLESGWYILGREVEAFEIEFADYIGVDHAVGVGSGTDALELALRACGIGSGDIVFTVSHTAVATAASIELVGAVPVFIDIDPVSYTMDANHLEYVIKAISSHPSADSLRPKAVIPVHLYGHPADMPAILDVARRHHLYVIEDCAQASGASLAGRRMGSWSDLAAFSFYPTKNLGAMGDGGMVLTNDPSLSGKIRSLRQYGWQERKVSEIPGLNSRLDELQAAILRVKLGYLDRENDRRIRLARVYTDLLEDTPLNTPQTSPNVNHVYHQYVVRTPKRDALRAYLHQNDISTLIHYEVPVHLQPAYHGRLSNFSSLPRTETFSSEILSLPMFPEMSEDQVKKVSEKIKAWDPLM